MFNMNSAMMSQLLKSQLKQLKKVRLEFLCEASNLKRQYRIKDHSLHKKEACLILEDLGNGEEAQLTFKL